MSEKELVLASGSPRRKWLMEQAGFNIKVIVPNVKENHPLGMESDQIPIHLAEKKAHAIFDTLSQSGSQIVVAADSVVILEDKVLEKPQDHREAYRMLATLSGKKHRVVTGVCILSAKSNMSFAGHTNVFFRELDHEEIEYYIDRYKPYDKAGAYGIQEWIGFCKVSKIEGSYANVMGLPMDLVYEGLKLICAD